MKGLNRAFKKITLQRRKTRIRYWHCECLFVEATNTSRTSGTR